MLLKEQETRLIYKGNKKITSNFSNNSASKKKMKILIQSIEMKYPLNKSYTQKLKSFVAFKPTLQGILKGLFTTLLLQHKNIKQQKQTKYLEKNGKQNPSYY